MDRALIFQSLEKDDAFLIARSCWNPVDMRGVCDRNEIFGLGRGGGGGIGIFSCAGFYI